MSVVDGATHTQKDDVESNGGSLENVAEVFVLFLYGVLLVLRSGVFKILDLNKVNVTPSLVEVFRSMLSGVGGLVALLVAGGAAGMLPVSLNCPLPLRRTHPPAVFCCFRVFAARDGSNQHKIWVAGGKSVFIWETGWEEPFGNYSTFSCFRNLEILHGHLFVAAYIYGDNA